MMALHIKANQRMMVLHEKSGIRPLGTTNVCTQFHGNPSDIYRDIPVWQKWSTNQHGLPTRPTSFRQVWINVSFTGQLSGPVCCLPICLQLLVTWLGLNLNDLTCGLRLGQPHFQFPLLSMEMFGLGLLYKNPFMQIGLRLRKTPKLD